MLIQFTETGTRYHRLILLEDLGKTGKIRRWKMLCDCGATKIISASAVKVGNTKSCGCLGREYRHSHARSSPRQHGMLKTPTYNSWNSMISRCKYQGKKHYNGKGITVCERWKTFPNFLEDMGLRPLGKTLDRIDSKGNYEPSNCQWATAIDQHNNQSNNVFLTFDGKTKTIAEWAREIGLADTTLNGRIKRGWDVGRAITTPLLRQRLSSATQ